MRIVIGIAGRIGVGKDVMARRLAERYGFSVVRFSQALKDEVLTRLPRTLEAIRQSLNLNDSSVYELVHLVKPPIIRELLQEYGTEVRRGDKDSYWVDKWLETIGQLASIQNGGLRVVAPDLRFGNEYRAIKDLGGMTVHIARPGHEDTGTHLSENGLLGYNFDARFNNVGSEQDFLDQIDRWAPDNL
jgi:hypothetical protein